MIEMEYVRTTRKIEAEDHDTLTAEIRRNVDGLANGQHIEALAIYPHIGAGAVPRWHAIIVVCTWRERPRGGTVDAATMISEAPPLRRLRRHGSHLQPVEVERPSGEQESGTESTQT